MLPAKQHLGFLKDRESISLAKAFTRGSYLFPLARCFTAVCLSAWGTAVLLVTNLVVQFDEDSPTTHWFGYWEDSTTGRGVCSAASWASLVSLFTTALLPESWEASTYLLISHSCLPQIPHKCHHSSQPGEKSPDRSTNATLGASHSAQLHRVLSHVGNRKASSLELSEFSWCSVRSISKFSFFEHCLLWD